MVKYMLLSLPMVPLTVASLKCQHMSYLAYPRKNSSFWRIRCRHARRRSSRKHRRHLRARWSKARNNGFSERACSLLREIAIGCSDRRRKVSRSPMSAGGGIEARKQSSSEQKKTSSMTERSNTRSDTDVAVHRKSDCERLAMLPLVRAMYEVVFAPLYCRINRHFTRHVPEFMQFATTLVDADGAEAFAIKVALQPLARLLRENALYHEV